MMGCAQQDALSTCLRDPPNITPALSGRIRRSVMYGSQPENGGAAADRPDCLRLLHITDTVGRDMHTAMCTHARDQVPARLLLEHFRRLARWCRCSSGIILFFSFLLKIFHRQITQMRCQIDSVFGKGVLAVWPRWFAVGGGDTQRL